MCSLFSFALDPAKFIELEITAKSLGEKESLCISRLLALSRIRSYIHNPIMDINISLDVEQALSSQFDYKINIELVQIYLAFEFGRIWVDLKHRGGINGITDV
jgi:hypothetical protein